jgi:hypothetical protein
MTAWLSIRANTTVLANTTANLASAERGLNRVRYGLARPRLFDPGGRPVLDA